MPSDTELTRIYSTIDYIDKDNKELSKEVASLKTTIELLSVEIKSMSTSIHNLSHSFGSLKERSNNILSSLNMVSNTRDATVENIAKSSTSRLDDFQSLCSTRVASIEYKISSIKEATMKEIRALNSNLSEDILENKQSIKAINTKINIALYTAIANLISIIVWLLKALGESYGWWK